MCLLLYYRCLSRYVRIKNILLLFLFFNFSGGGGPAQKIAEKMIFPIKKVAKYRCNSLKFALMTFFFYFFLAFQFLGPPPPGHAHADSQQLERPTDTAGFHIFWEFPLSHGFSQFYNYHSFRKVNKQNSELRILELRILFNIIQLCK